MKRCFILDENTVIAAYTGKNEHGEYDPSAANLLLDIACNCHLIVLTNELEKKYFKRVDQLEETQVMFLNMANVIHHIHMNPRKTKFFEYLPHIELPKTIHNDDPNIVRLAIHSQGILVTADGRLRNSLVDANLIQKHRLTVVSPEEAIKYAGPNDPEPLLRP